MTNNRTQNRNRLTILDHKLLSMERRYKVKGKITIDYRVPLRRDYHCILFTLRHRLPLFDEN